MNLSRARPPADAHQVGTRGIDRIGKPKTDVEQSVSLNFREIIGNAVNSGGAVNRISFTHE
jgi:hypothetical protein